MKCPLMPDKDYSIQLEKHLNGGDCLKEECAWWNSELEACVLVSLDFDLISLIGALTAIGDKMPHEEQFRR